MTIALPFSKYFAIRNPKCFPRAKDRPGISSVVPRITRTGGLCLLNPFNPCNARLMKFFNVFLIQGTSRIRPTPFANMESQVHLAMPRAMHECHGLRRKSHRHNRFVEGTSALPQARTGSHGRA